MKKPERINNLKAIEPVSKDCAYLGYMSDTSNNFYPSKTQWRERLRYSMLEWSEKESSLEVEQFCIEYKIPKRTLYHWAKQYDDIRQTIDDVKIIIASRRRVFSMTNKINGNYAYRDMHRLDPSWVEVDQYHANLKNQTEQNNFEKIKELLVAAQKPF